ncbi:hypothetical protein ACIBED_06155 [Rhodococcus coprophilus]|uniref:Uncharacterized protein n=1 Tax=Rhodococcus coprophilus TaxID=38310 RepID=A0A2X4XFD5_9NOCA|nr:hypothetical protein [Rhodococcus coprophilus]MBM7460146.1 hypothetical protein [Rhodococcus coprophilus]SQI38605.1 Uncharacterised protein [Rhodococcus coprophilus]
MLAPERRTRTDLLVAATLVATVLVAASVVWFRSDARGTTSITWGEPVSSLPAAGALPDDLVEVWEAPSDATSVPVALGGTVATAHAGAVVGRDPLTGDERWRYERNRPLCAVAGAWGSVVSVYRDARGCGQVTALEADSGARDVQRTSHADDEIRLFDAGSYVISLGDTRLEMWRSDLVRTVEYGYVDAPVNPRAQPRSGCTLISADAGSSRLAVLEQCPNEPANRLTLLDPSPDDNQKPEQYASSVLPEAAPGAGARIVAVLGERTAVYVPPGDGGAPRIAVYDGSGALLDTHDLARAAGDNPGPATEHEGVLVWWTGVDTVALSPDDFTPEWTVENTLGTGAPMAGTLLLPVDDAVAAVDPASGDIRQRIPVDRGDAQSVDVAVAGDLVLEQRGGQLVALR